MADTFTIFNSVELIQIGILLFGGNIRSILNPYCTVATNRYTRLWGNG